MNKKDEKTVAAVKKVMSTVQDAMEYGYMRWQNEKDYEDINDYSILFEKKLDPLVIKFLKMTKRPFGFKFTAGGKKFQLAITAKRYYVKLL